MNREEILAMSQQENENKLDERSKAIQTKANSISQGVGMVMCVIVALLGTFLTWNPVFGWCCLSIYGGMFAAERIVCAVKEKTVGQWVGASVTVLAEVVFLVEYVKTLLAMR